MRQSIAAANSANSHRATGFGVESDLEASIALGRRFEQEAIYWISDDQLFVVDCSDCQKVYVGDWKSRLVQANESPKDYDMKRGF